MPARKGDESAAGAVGSQHGTGEGGRGWEVEGGVKDQLLCCSDDVTWLCIASGESGDQEGC